MHKLIRIWQWEIIIVDDGSRDKIEEVVAPYVKKASSGRVRLMHLAVNQGKGAAVRKVRRGLTLSGHNLDRVRVYWQHVGSLFTWPMPTWLPQQQS